MYKIAKLINNNIVCSIDVEGNEVILRGLGIGFNKKVNDSIEDEKVEKIYKMANKDASNKLQELLAEIPIEYVTVCTEIIEYATKTLNKKLNDNIYITLTDHISFAITRKDNKLEYRNVLLTEIKTFYEEEYQIGVQALEIIKDKLGVELSYDEAGFIALHIVNAELDTNMGNMVKITELIQKVMELIYNYYGKEIDEDSLNYKRFITHLKFFGQRIFTDKATEEDDEEFRSLVKNRYPIEYQCAENIGRLVLEQYSKKVTEEELMFLTIHLKRLQMS
ncbi:BglG family transcription antiterminator LicT [Anaerosporobacter sp.]|uniref:BglG family transcription antiterminator LicT n=1 Tax=Anaerosporobacter sp. TaxID=1872529 RepID=UPI0028A0497C|nr:PRD domain-containing protein [Anaerosporobacter sp.]